MDLTIIIVNWNTRDLLRRCLASIQAAGEGILIQTIVVDNNSADGSREVVAGEFPTVRVMNSGGNLGFAKANNIGLKHAVAPLILFLNPDTEVTGSALQRMVAMMQAEPEVGALGCRIRDISGELQPLGLQYFPTPWTELLRILAASQWSRRRFPRLFPTHNPDQSGYVSKLFGACLLVRRSVLDQVGSFDDRYFMYCEDVDLCHRITSAGWKLYYMADTEILHLGASASAKAPGAFAVLMTCESFAKLMRKHYGAMGAVLYRVVIFFGAQVRLVMLCLINVLQRLGCGSWCADIRGATQKYLTMIRWALGLERPVIRD